MKVALRLSNSLSTRLLTVIALFTHAHIVCLLTAAALPWFGSKADIVMLKNMPQNKPAAAVNSRFWADGDIMTVRQTADHVNGCFKAVCRSLKDHVISPCAICRHVLKVISPRNTSMYEVEQFRPIRLQEKEIPPPQKNNKQTNWVC